MHTAIHSLRPRCSAIYTYVYSLYSSTDDDSIYSYNEVNLNYTFHFFAFVNSLFALRDWAH